MPCGLYISVPFCRTKCSYCNFASEVFSREVFARYVDRVCADIAAAEQTAARMGGGFERQADSLYFGGGTPSVLNGEQLRRLCAAARETFQLESAAEITVECAPGTVSAELLGTLIECGVNRVSLGVQSFVDGEAAAVGRLHSRAVALDDIARLRAAGIANLNLDLIAGLPHQTPASWRRSVDEAIATGAPHVSLYMLEVDENSRLGRELLAGGSRYHAHFVPDEDATADFYLEGCELLEGAGLRQYEISNFAREGCESRHNLKYWTRQPYLGFGVDAHSMLHTMGAASKPAFGLGGRFHPSPESVRFATPDSLDEYLSAGAPSKPAFGLHGESLTRAPVSREAALEEAFFLGLRLVRGVDLRGIAADFGDEAQHRYAAAIAELREAGLVTLNHDVLRLTARGRLLSNEVFQRFLLAQPAQR